MSFNRLVGAIVLGNLYTGLIVAVLWMVIFQIATYETKNERILREVNALTQ
jgi:hypothetical protein